MNEQTPTGPADETLAATAAAPKPPGSLLPFDRVGPYRLIKTIGLGGMGEVFYAEQLEPIRRDVALKIIKPGMDSREIVARFEAERQALALMEHPYIARVYDAGATDQGRPYFVMEYIQGVPLTEYCDKQKLGIRDRLRLFMKVIEAVQHAHRKGIIHRDLKPSNILVVAGDPPTPKIIDFGVAKATGANLSANTAFTALGQMIGTPEYMSPEQADSKTDDIDTRTDIYALGVILYELLTGSLPFDMRAFRKAGFEAMRKQIREAEWPRPSTRISSLGDQTTASAVNRHTDAPRLQSILRGDLDWITMKALEKDRDRRYETANAFALDIGRYLEGEAVLASPPSATYRLVKTIRKHRGAFSALAAILVLLTAATIVSTSQYLTARREAARSAQIAAFLKSMLGGVAPSVAVGRDTKMLAEILDHTSERVGQELRGQPEVEAEIRSVLANTYGDMGDYAKAERHQMRAVELLERARGTGDALTLAARSALGGVYVQLGRLEEADSLLKRTAAAQSALRGDADPKTLTTLSLLAASYSYQVRAAEAESIGARIVPLLRRELGDSDLITQSAMNTQAVTLADDGKYAASESLFVALLKVAKHDLGVDHPTTLRVMTAFGWMYREQGRLPEAERLTRESLERERRVFGNEHSDTQAAVNNLGIILSDMKRPAEAEPYYLEGLTVSRRTLGEKHPETLASMVNLATFYLKAGEWPKAIALSTQSIDLFTQAMPPDFMGKGVAYRVRGDAQLKLGHYAEADRDLSEAMRIVGKQNPPESPRMQAILASRIAANEKLGRAQIVAQLRTKLIARP